MLLYNVTLIIDGAEADEMLQWITEIHIPQIIATKKFVSNRILKVIDSPNEGVTYCMQYIAESIEDYEEYNQNFAPALQADLQQKFENKFVAYHTLMEYIA